MKKITSKLSFILIISFALFLMACSDGNGGSETKTNDSGGGDDVTKIRIANIVSEENYQNRAQNNLKETLEAEGDGLFEMDISFGSSVAKSDQELIELIQSGTLEMASVSAYSLASPTGIDGFAIFDVPYLFKDRDEYNSFIDGPYGQYLIEEVEENKNMDQLKVLGFVDQGFYSVLSTKDPIHEPEDMSGLVIRSSPADLQLGFFNALNANPTPMDYGEIFTGLQQGTIDGLSTALPLIYEDRFYEAGKNVTLTNQIILSHALVVNKDFYNSLSGDKKEIFDEVVQDYLMEYRTYIDNVETEAIAELEAAGLEVVKLTDEERELFKAATESVIENNMDVVGQENYDKALEILGN